MRDDLLDAQAAIDWAATQLPTLEQRIVAWLNDDPYRLVTEPHPERGQKLVKLRDVKPIPAIVNAEVGVIINSIRASLDLLASAVARRYSVLGNIEVYFPIADSAADWATGNYKGSKFVKALPADASQIFETLKPYPGGNDTLVALHHLDIMRKHRRLISVQLLPKAVVVTPNLLASGFGMPGAWPGFKEDAVIAWFNMNATQGEFQAPINVTFNEASLLPAHPVVPALCDFASTAENIIMLFDTP